MGTSRSSQAPPAVGLVTSAVGFLVLLWGAIFFLTDPDGSFESHFNVAVRVSVTGLVVLTIAIVVSSIALARFWSPFSWIAFVAAIAAMPLVIVIYFVLLPAFFS
jgi:hypothetical protein